jgi:hypothetical protein
MPEKRMFLSIISDYDVKTGICELIDNAIDLWTSSNRKKELRVDVELDAVRHSKDRKFYCVIEARRMENGR